MQVTKLDKLNIPSNARIRAHSSVILEFFTENEDYFYKVFQFHKGITFETMTDEFEAGTSKFHDQVS
jgi:hypothetical protein